MQFDAPLPEDPWLRSINTSVACHRIASFVDVCVYEDICSDGLYWYFIDADALKKNRTRDTVTYPVSDFKTGVIFPQAPIPPPGSNAMFPYNTGGKLIFSYVLMKAALIGW